jgi:hypothetical protein
MCTYFEDNSYLRFCMLNTSNVNELLLDYAAEHARRQSSVYSLLLGHKVSPIFSLDTCN